MKTLKLSNLKFLNLIFLLILFIFGRVFMGLNILTLRLGEILIGISALFFIYFLVKDLVNFKYLSKEDKNFTIIFALAFFHTVYLLLFYGYEFFNLYPFKASSYIWVLGFFYVGKNYNYNFSSKKSLISIFLALVLSYFSSIFGITNEYQDFLLRYTDKFDYLKASDLIIFFIFFLYFYKLSTFNNQLNLNVCVFLFSIFYLPLMMNKSRGASIAFLLLISFLIYELIKLKKSKNFYILTIFLSFLIFVLSAFIVSKSPLDLEEIDDKIIYVSTSRYEKPVQNTPQVIDDYPILYTEGRRLFSSDGNLNWRLQIWQDVFQDTYLKNAVFSGYGYNNKIPAMEPEYRSGNDGTNENVHNFFVNVYARGGLIHLLLYISFFVILFRSAEQNNRLKILAMFFVPLIFTSFFDASMENAHYPLIFYFLMGKITYN